MNDSTCPICAGPVEFGRRVAGWTVCSKHRVGVKPSKYSRECSACGGRFDVGERVVMTKHLGRWVVLHVAARCIAALPAPAGNPHRRTLFVTDDAPVEVVKAAYKALSLRAHPDRGGSTEAMQRLNAALERALAEAQR